VPSILGHEIVELGEGVTHDSGDCPSKVGDRITWTIMDNCGKCYYCREKGLMMKCRSLKKYGHDSCADPPHFLGVFAEYCYITPGTCVIKVPDDLTDEVVAPANCALSTVVVGWEAIEIKPYENVLIEGVFFLLTSPLMGDPYVFLFILNYLEYFLRNSGFSHLS
jgi:D-arabinose 1-dehydrogenase-like Zn-dependent alcohol dehydrogenase